MRSCGSCLCRRADEDRTILDAVDELGQKWRVVAQRLVGRSDDAVRNRWKRLNKERLAMAAEAGQASSLGGEMSAADGSEAGSLEPTQLHDLLTTGNESMFQRDDAASGQPPLLDGKLASRSMPEKQRIHGPFIVSWVWGWFRERQSTHRQSGETTVDTR